jgi:hypothetical protein
LEDRHRAQARVEDRIRCAKDTGLENFPFRSFAANQVWLELVLAAQDLLVCYKRLCLEGEASDWEPKKLRYRLLHTVGRMIRTGRRQILRLQRNWPWTALLAGCLQAAAPAARHRLSLLRQMPQQCAAPQSAVAILPAPRCLPNVPQQHKHASKVGNWLVVAAITTDVRYPELYETHSAPTGDWSRPGGAGKVGRHSLPR